MSHSLKDPSIDFYKPFQSGEGTCYPLYPENYYRTQYTPMFGGKTRKHKGGNKDITYSNGVNLDLKGGKRKSQKGGNLGDVEKFSMFGQPTSSTLTEKFSSNNMGITYATQAGGKRKKSQKGGVNAAEYYTDSLTGSYSPKNLYSDEKVKSEKCGGRRKSRSRSRSLSKKRGGSKSRSVSKKRGGSRSRSSSKRRNVSKSLSKRRGGSKKQNRSRSRSLSKNRGGWASMGDAGRYNPYEADSQLSRLNYQTAGGIQYRGAPSPNTPSNFSDGDIFHPEWKYTAKGGKKKSQKGGQNIFTPGAIPFGVATSEPAGAQVQMGLGEHVMKAPKDFVGSILGNTGDAQTKAGELLRSFTGGSRRKQRGAGIIDDLISSTKGITDSITGTLSSYVPTTTDPNQALKNLSESVKIQNSKDAKIPDVKTISATITKTVSSQSGGSKRKQKGAGLIDSLAGTIQSTLSSYIPTTTDPSQALKNLSDSVKIQNSKDVKIPDVKTISGSVTKNVGDVTKTLSAQVQQVKNSGTKFQSGGKRRKQKAGYLSACDFSSPTSQNKIPIPGAIPLEISGSVSQGAQDQMYGDGYTRMRGPRDLILPGVGDASSEAIQAQMGPLNGGKKKSRKHRGGDGDSGGVGSDFALTLASRGPVNYPDGPSADRFRFFNKSAEYIPNSMLKWAAAPILTGWKPDPNPYPQAYNDYCGGNKKTKKSKKVKKTKSRSRSRK